MNTREKNDWTRSEPRIVRPFFAAKQLKDALKACGLRLKAGERFDESDSIRVPASEVGLLEPTLRLSIDQGAISGLPDEDAQGVKCMVFVENSFVKRTDLVEQLDLNLRESIDLEIPIDLARRIRFGSSSRITIALCLTEQRAKIAGKPYRKGHWLAKKIFDVNVERDATAFSIEPLDEPVRKRFSLPEGTLYYINYIGGFNEPMEPESPPARVYVAKEVIDRLALATQQKTSAVVESMLAAEITSFLVTKAFSEMGVDEDVAQGSPLASLLKRLQEVFSVDAGAVRRWSTENNGLTLRAYLHADSQTVRSILSN